MATATTLSRSVPCSRRINSEDGCTTYCKYYAKSYSGDSSDSGGTVATSNDGETPSHKR